LGLARHFHRLRGRHNTQLLALSADEPNWTNANLLVDTLATVVRWMTVGWGNAFISFSKNRAERFSPSSGINLSSLTPPALPVNSLDEKFDCRYADIVGFYRPSRLDSVMPSDIALPPDADQRDLATAGYKQELDRTLGRFSSFAAGFSYISILTGMFQNFHLGFSAGGPAFFWTWPLMFAGQLMVALCFAELAAQYPLCGGVYQWSRHVGSRAVGWMAGWVYLASLVVTLAAVALALQVSLPQISPLFQLIGSADNAEDAARNAVLFGCLLIGFSTLINSIGVGLLAKINNVGVFAELVGVVLLIVLLAVHAVRGPAVLFDTRDLGTGLRFGYLGPFMAAMIMASYVMYGFDTAGSLAEETKEPRRTAPRAILQALIAAAVAGALLMFFAMLAVGNIHAEELGKSTGGLPYIVTSTLGESFGKVFLGDVIFAITVCTLAVHTGTVRVLFAMSRDNQLPFGSLLSRVAPRARVPIPAAIVVGAAAAIILLVNVHSYRLIAALIPVSIVWANLAYLLVTVPLLIRRLRSRPAPADGLFRLGAWGLPVNVLAVLWGIITVVNMAWPRPETPDEPWFEQFAALLFTAILGIIGMVYYWIVQRHKPDDRPGASPNVD
jgi:urea carboxylase system permease